MKKLLFFILAFVVVHSHAQNPQDCINAIKICTNTYVQNSSFSGFGNQQEIIPGGNTCLNNGETNSSWYSFRIKTSGTINFTIDPLNPLDDYDFVLYNITNGSCADILSGTLPFLRCNYSSTTGTTGLSPSTVLITSPSNGPPYCAQLNCNAEDTYILMVNNFTASAGGYTLNFTGTATIYDTEPPDFINSDANPCSPDKVYLYFDELVEEASIAGDGSDFIITGPSGVIIDSAGIYVNGNNPDPIRVTFASIITVPGIYTITIQQGSDGNTLSDYCGNFMQAGASFTFQVTNTPPNPDVASISNATCLDPTGSATMVINGGAPPFNYFWSTIPVQTGLTATNLLPGFYVFNVIDANGCQAAQSVNIGVDNLPAIFTAVTPEICYDSASGGASVIVQGGIAPYSYNWSTTPVSNDSAVTGLVAGTYTVTVTDASGCQVSQTVVIIESELPLVDVTGAGISCNGLIPGSLIAEVTGNGPFTYSWNTSPPTLSDTMTSFNSGMYNCIVTDVNGCSIITSDSIVGGYMLLSAVTTDAGCPDNPQGTASVTATGGIDPLTYLWNTNPPQTTSTISSLAAGDYEVTVTDSGNCVSTLIVNVSGPPPLVIDITTQEAGCSLSDGSAMAQASGGNSPYIYQWLTAPPQNGALLDNIPAGIYNVLVIDNLGCTQTNTAYVSNFDGPQGFIAASTEATCRQANGTASVDIINGAAPFSYQWLTTPPQFGMNAVNLPEGINIVRIEDANGCLSFLNVKINAIPMGYLYAGPVINASCGFSDGIATVLDSLSVPPLQYEWNTTPVQYTKTANGLEAGSLWVYTVDGTGCRDSLQLNIGENPALTNFSFTPGCLGDETTFIGSSSYPGAITWTWSFGDTSSSGISTGQTANHLYNSAGSYPVVLYTFGGCATDTVSKNIIAGIKPVAGFVTDQQVIFAETAVNFYYTGSPVANYLWNFNDGGLSYDSSPSHNFLLNDSATVTLIVTDQYGCRDTVTHEFAMDTPPSLYIPNCFTPNGDGINDTFIVPAHGLDKCNLKIFSRWGEVIFETENVDNIISNGWDGKYNGTISPQGVYTYRLNGNYKGGKSVEKSGLVTLLR